MHRHQAADDDESVNTPCDASEPERAARPSHRDVCIHQRPEAAKVDQRHAAEVCHEEARAGPGMSP